jgi:hypothetical protein
MKENKKSYRMEKEDKNKSEITRPTNSMTYVVCLKSSVNGTRKQQKTEDTNKLTLLTFKIIAILHNTLLATSIKLVETVNKDQQCAVKDGDYLEGQ